MAQHYGHLCFKMPCHKHVVHNYCCCVYIAMFLSLFIIRSWHSIASRPAVTDVAYRVVCILGTPITCPNKKLSYRRETARCVVSVEILPIATQQCSTTSPEQIEVMKLEG